MDAGFIPFATATFDVIIANNMLYHVSDRGRALGEIARVLRPEGTLFAMTFGWKNLLELRQWISEFGLETTFLPPEPVTGTFDLEQGQEELAQWFSNVQVAHYLDALVVTEVAPLLDYVRSMAGLVPFSEERWQAFVTFLEEKMAALGSLRIQKAYGLLTARGLR